MKRINWPFISFWLGYILLLWGLGYHFNPWRQSADAAVASIEVSLK